MNNLTPMKNCPGGGGMQDNLKWMQGYMVHVKTEEGKYLQFNAQNICLSIFLWHKYLIPCIYMHDLKGVQKGENLQKYETLICSYKFG